MEEKMSASLKIETAIGKLQSVLSVLDGEGIPDGYKDPNARGIEQSIELIEEAGKAYSWVLKKKRAEAIKTKALVSVMVAKYRHLPEVHVKLLEILKSIGD